MKALIYERSPARYAAAKLLGRLATAKVSVTPLRLTEIDPPKLPSPEWVQVVPRLSGICGSDLATIESGSSRYLEDFVSFPFVMGHEIVGNYQSETGELKRAVVIPSLNCEVRGISPKCRFCEMGQPQQCQMLHFGDLGPGLQTGFCTDTSGGWSTEIVAHRSQLVDIPDSLSDEEAVLLEPFSCAVHAALSIGTNLNSQVAVIGSGTLGLLIIAALRQLNPSIEIIATAKYATQKLLAKEFGASVVCSSDELYRQARTIRNAHMIASDKPSDGFEVVFDAVGSPSSIEQALKVAAPGAHVILVGMPRDSRIDLTPLWMKELSLIGAYAYGLEEIDGQTIRTFDLAVELAPKVGLSKLLSATYRLEDYEVAIDHAANAGKRGAIKIAFDMRKKSNTESWSQNR